MLKEIVSIKWHDLGLGQLMYVQAVVMPEVIHVIEQHLDAIKELEDLEENE